MKRLIIYIAFSLCMISGIGQGIIIDHTSTNLDEIPMSIIDDVQANLRFHYAHYSHGSQLLCGLQLIEDNNPAYSVAIGGGYNGNNNIPPYLPTEAGALCIYNGNCGYTIENENYWKPEASGHCTENTLNGNPTINVSGWQWCEQLNYYTEDQVQEYLNAMTAYEQQFPNVTFVYMTGNAQAGGEPGYNRHMRCDQIRNYCITNNKVLFDFEDLDAWYNGQQSTYLYNGEQIPYQHSAYNGNDCGHANDLNSLNKGKAIWMFMAKLRGYTGNLNILDKISKLQMGCILFPNPASNYLDIEVVNLKEELHAISLINLSGEVIIRKEYEDGECGLKRIDIEQLSKGLYIVNIQCGDGILFEKFIKL